MFLGRLIFDDLQYINFQHFRRKNKAIKTMHEKQILESVKNEKVNSVDIYFQVGMN